MDNKEFDITPEHSSRYKAQGYSEEVQAVYDYVNKVTHTSDAVSPQGGRAWHGWALREAFLAGCSYSSQRRTNKVAPTLKEISDWIISEQRSGSKWAEKVDHHDALPIACAAIYDFAEFSGSPGKPSSQSFSS